MNETQDDTLETGGAAEPRFLARLHRLLRTAERARSLAERMEGRCHTARAGAAEENDFAAMQADAGELKSLADDLVLLGHSFREAAISPVFAALRVEAADRSIELRIDDLSHDLRIDQRLLPVLRERLQELILLLLELQAAQKAGAQGPVHLAAQIVGRSLSLTLRCEGLELGAADLVRAARNGGHAAGSPETLLRFPGRLLFTPAFATGWGLPGTWCDRLQGLRDRLRTDRGDLLLREDREGQWLFNLRLPLSADLAAVLEVRSGAERFALPIEAVFSTRRVEPAEWRRESGRLWLDQAAPEPLEGCEFADWTAAGPVMAVPLPHLLDEGPAMAPTVPQTALPCVILEDGDGMVAVVVDEILGERQVLLRHPRQLLRRVPLLLGSFLLPGEEIGVVLHPWDLLQRARSGAVA